MENRGATFARPSDATLAVRGKKFQAE